MDTTQELPTVIAFCAGYGGIERGLDLCGVKHRVVAYVEIEAYAIANLVAKMEQGQLDPAPIYTDIKTFPAHLFRGRVDIITGGYPCQPFSMSGNRKGADDPRHLWPHIRRHIESIRPIQCFFENVEGHISLGLSTVVSDLEEDGYRTTWGIFSASEVGAPHQRKRVFIMANRNSVRCEWGQLPNRIGERPVEVKAQQRPEQPLVRSEAKRCSGDCGKYVANTDLSHSQGGCVSSRVHKEYNQPDCTSSKTREKLADSRCSASAKSEQQAELWATGASESPGGAWQDSGQRANAERQVWPARAGEEQYEWEQPRVVWKAESSVGRTVDGCPNRVDRLRLLGNAVVPQTAAKAYTTLSGRLV